MTKEGEDTEKVLKMRKFSVHVGAAILCEDDVIFLF
jgi:hypothetical protein